MASFVCLSLTFPASWPDFMHLECYFLAPGSTLAVNSGLQHATIELKRSIHLFSQPLVMRDNNKTGIQLPV